jgi:hypothetical protein
VGIAPRDFQGRWERWETARRFSTASTGRHFHRLRRRFTVHLTVQKSRFHREITVFLP